MITLTLQTVRGISSDQNGEKISTFPIINLRKKPVFVPFLWLSFNYSICWSSRKRTIFCIFLVYILEWYSFSDCVLWNLILNFWYTWEIVHGFFLNSSVLNYCKFYSLYLSLLFFASVRESSNPSLNKESLFKI